MQEFLQVQFEQEVDDTNYIVGNDGSKSKKISQLEELEILKSKIVQIDGKYKCPIEKCDFENKHRGNLTQHIRSHNDCLQCGKVFYGRQSKFRVRGHIKRDHTDFSVEHRCQFCNAKYQFHSYLEKHEFNCRKKFLAYNKLPIPKILQQSTM